MRIVRRRLKIPFHLSGIGVQGDDTRRVEAIARRRRMWRPPHRHPVARPEVIKIELRIVGAVQPRIAAAMQHGVVVRPGFRARLAGIGRHPPAPLLFSRLRIARFQPGPDVAVVARCRDHVISNNQRRDRGEPFLLHFGDLHSPALFAGFGVQREQPVVRRHVEQPVAVHAQPAVGHVNGLVIRPLIMPELAA